jgi:hypothetical protein
MFVGEGGWTAVPRADGMTREWTSQHVGDHSMITRITIALFCVSVLAGIAGCYESPDVHVYEPGVYKGDRDPLIQLEGTEKQQERLRDRFQLVQTDR